MDTKEKIDLLFKKISRYDFYINSTNGKTSIIIAWNGIIIGTILLKYTSIIALYLMSVWAYYAANVLLIIMAATSIVSIAFVFKVINPFLSSGFKGISYKSLMFFGDVAEMSLNEYTKKESDLSYEEALSDAMGQAHILATGVNNKMKNMQQSIRAINLGLLALLILVLLKGVIVYVSRL
ncbi:MAG: Pycsar system effector family protein [Thermodesulfobacteriota bacterium]